MSESANRPVLVGLDDDTCRKSDVVTSWSVEADGTLWLYGGSECIAVYAATRWRWVERSPATPEADPPCCTPTSPHPAAPEVDR